MRIRAGFVAFLLLVVSVRVGYSQSTGLNLTSGDLSFSGRVIVPQVDFDDTIEILLVRTDEENDFETLAYTYTDSRGLYAFSGLPAGTYFLKIELEGYRKVRERVMLLPHDNVSAAILPSLAPVVNIFMDRVAPKSSGPPSPDSGVVDLAALSRKYPKKAVDEFSKAIEENGKGNASKAVERLESAVKLAPEFYDAHLNLGLMFQKLGRRDDAERELRRASELSSQAALPFTQLGRLYIDDADRRSGDGAAALAPIMEQAKAALETATRRDPSSALAHLLLGTVHLRSARFEQAEEELRTALVLDKSLGQSHLMLANVYTRQNKWESALHHLDTFLAENPAAPNRKEVESARLSVARQLEGVAR